jgi:hypothetical protein
MSLFGAFTGANMAVSLNLLRPDAEVEQIDYRQLLNWERELIGVYLSEHPLERKLAHLQENVRTTAVEVDSHSNGKDIRLAGIITHLRPYTTKKGESMAFAALEDLRGKVDLVFFPRTWKQYHDQVKVDQILVVQGKVKADNDSVSIAVESVQSNVIIARDADSEDSSYFTGSDFYAPAMDSGEYDTGADDTVEMAAFVPALSTGAAPVATGATVADASPLSPDPDTYWPTETKPVNGRTIVNGQAGNGHENHSLKIVVEVKPDGNWKSTCRQSLHLSEKFDGQDHLNIRLLGQSLAIDFPNHRTQFCPELVSALEGLSGVVRVYVA